MTSQPSIREILDKQIGHYWVDGDNWYSCPKAPDGCCDESRGTECDCGLDKKVDTILSEIRKRIEGLKISDKATVSDWEVGYSVAINEVLEMFQ
jgi:hypothetical protein